MNENISLQQFYSVISEQYTKENSFAKMLTSAIEFETFIQMMVDVRYHNYYHYHYNYHHYYHYHPYHNVII